MLNDLCIAMFEDHHHSITSSLTMNTYQPDQGGSDQDIKWATMIPLIGGSALGCQKATGVLPQFHLSYSPFSKNEAHLKRYWPQVPMLYLDKMPKMVEFGNEKIDFVNSVCPCAGLSMLNVCKKGETARGSDAVQNDWMLKSAEFVLSYIKPKVLWGENAPGLFDNPGKDLVEKLKVIAQKYYYSFSMVKTNSELHGLPQRRMRTFYFFWKSPTVPFLQWKETKAPPLVEYLKQIPKWATFQDVFVHDGKASERFRPYQYVLLKEQMTHQEFSKKIGRSTIAKYLEKNGLIDECIMWLKTYFPNDTFSNAGTKKCRTHIDVLEHMKRKLDQGLGYWDDSVKFMGTSFTAVISKNIEYAVHPTEDRFFSVRELLHLMGMPHDYQIDHIRNLNHICQNVPVNTAKDFAEEVVKFCQGKSEMTRFSFMKQDNVNKHVVETFPPETLEEKLAGRQNMVNKRSPKRKSFEIKSEVKFFKKEIESSPIENMEAYQRNVIRYFDSKTEVDIKPIIKTEPVMNFSISGLSSQMLPNVPSPTMLSNSVQIFRKTSPVSLSGPVIKIEDSDEEPENKMPEHKISPTKRYRCGLCNYLTTTKEYLEAHWMTDCRLTTNSDSVKPANPEDNNVYSCGECATRVKSVDAMKAHWKNRCTGFPQGQLKQAINTFSQPPPLPKQMLNSNITAILNGTMSNSISGRHL